MCMFHNHYSIIFATKLTIFLFLIILNIVVDCGPLGIPVNGQVDMSSGTTFMSTATYTCNTGYNLIGPISRTCGSDGVWFPAAPIPVNVSVTMHTWLDSNV